MILREIIKQLALESGFVPNEGGDLREYVYEFAQRIEEQTIRTLWPQRASPSENDITETEGGEM